MAAGIYPKHLDDGGRAALDKLYAEIKEHAEKWAEAKRKAEKAKIHRKFIPASVSHIQPRNDDERSKLKVLRSFMEELAEQRAAEETPPTVKVIKQYTNPFGVSITKLDDGDGFISNAYGYPPGQWPYDKEVVNQGLINLLVSSEPRLIRFWSQFASSEKSQKQFIHKLQFHISLWAWSKTHYETTASNFKHKIKAAAVDMKSLISKLQESDRLSGIADDEITNALNTRHSEVFGDDATNWNMYDERPLRLDDLLAKILQRFEEALEREPAAWYPKKMESKSADKIFLIRAIRRTILEFFDKASHVLIADMACILLNETITEEDVRKNLVDTNRKILAKTQQ